MIKNKKMEKSAWLLERSRLFAEYAGREPNICDSVELRLNNEKHDSPFSLFSVYKGLCFIFNGVFF